MNGEYVRTIGRVFVDIREDGSKRTNAIAFGHGVLDGSETLQEGAGERALSEAVRRRIDQVVGLSRSRDDGI